MPIFVEKVEFEEEKVPSKEIILTERFDKITGYNDCVRMSYSGRCAGLQCNERGFGHLL